MKPPAMKNTMDLLQKIESIEKEIKDLKIHILKRLSPSGKKAKQTNGKKGSLAGIIDIAKDCSDTDLSVHHDKSVRH